MTGHEELYRKVILDHYRNPCNKGELDTPPAHRTEGFNPFCGDEIVIYVDANEDGVVTDIKFGGQGCAISLSSASMMSVAVKGKTIAESRAITSAFTSLLNTQESSVDGDDAVSSADPDENVKQLTASLGDLAALQGLVKFPMRIKCATLSWNTLIRAFDEIAAEG